MGGACAPSILIIAFDTYPVDSEDYDIEMSLFVLIDQADKDLDSQAIVSGFYEGNKRMKMTVFMSTYLMIHNRFNASNKCPLKISLIGIPQEMPNEINSDGIIQTLVTNYAGQEEMEIISNEFYMYAKDVNYIDAQFLNKKSSFGCGGSQTSSSKKNICFKLLATYQSFLEILKIKFEVEDFNGFVYGGFTACENFTKSVDRNFEIEISIGLGSGFESNSVNSLCLQKQVHSDASEGSVGASYMKEVNDHADFHQKDDAEGSVNNSSYQKKSKLQKCQESMKHTLHCNLRSCTSDISFSKV
ncbi:3619_t:CDS:2 [Cetraspora pellucida]|uniref:3619_t:CDS:1 n=1 Tax=Cetraspora pellucida TaxID=1433469 RepID=A0A9N9B5L9_9GLOM|nr:3619_t:CDS:2 [Cetraspora pellucida]